MYKKGNTGEWKVVESPYFVNFQFSPNYIKRCMTALVDILIISSDAIGEQAACIGSHGLWAPLYIILHAGWSVFYCISHTNLRFLRLDG